MVFISPRSKKLVLTLSASIALVIAFGACTPKKKVEDGNPESMNTPITDSDINGGSADSDSGKAMGLETVHYAYDSAVLDSGAKATLKANAAVLKEKSTLRVQIEGHTDERGGIQYNIALGERRAASAKAFLADQGIGSDRLTIISLGKEKPVDMGHDESAWSKNRRANFRVTEK